MALQQTNRLVCAATWGELRAFDPRIEPSVEEIGFGRRDETLYLVTGVGVPRALERVLQVAARAEPRGIINIGIAGAYPNSGLGVGDIVMADSEVYGDLGMELPDAPGFQPLSETPFGDDYAEPFVLDQAPQFGGGAVGRGCTVSTCTGTDATGLLRERLHGAAFETMEGAAVAQAGHALGIPVCEIRAISNIAARRDMRPENIGLALARLTAHFEKCRGASHD